MKKLLITFSVIVSMALLLASCSKRSGKPRILVFSKTSGWNHTSIPDGIAALQKLGEEHGFVVDTTKDAHYFNEDSLKNYSAVVFLSTTGDVLNQYQQVAFERYIQAGGGFVGIHAASDTEFDWRWFGRLVGGYFASHPKEQEAVLDVVDQSHISTKHLPKQWKRTDEWYNFKMLSSAIKVLMTIDEKSYTGGTNGAQHPMAWYQEYDGGRSFYTGIGHTEESFADPLVLKHLLGGIQYAIGENKKLNYDDVTSQPIPDEDRFVKTVLTQGSFFEPTEMAILPNSDVLITQRRGELMLYSNDRRTVKQVGYLDVYYKTNTPGVNSEEGVLGIAADPNFKTNNYIYIFYSPADTSVNRLSRFEFKNDTIDNKTEKVVLQFYSQREICCHTGGSIAFGADNTLFLSTGDNSTPFNEPNARYVSSGFAPLNDLPGKQQYDARRTAGNTNDLRGKVLRIKIKPDGSYEIPGGNLFAPNEPKARPEIYAMGMRNPYRISVDKKTGFLYWGDVGPDAGTDSFNTRGPRGYDEINQARKAGYFGWPFFIGNNYPYRNFNYATGEHGEFFDAAKPVNNSANNTGLIDLPPAQPAYIWYPYDASHDFPQVGTGGRNAMAGPVYYTADFPKETRYPDYFNGKLFIYEWMRDWIKVVQMLPNGDFDKMDPFMENTSLNAVIDMEVGADGRMYILEYGKGWFTQNPEAGLARIDYIAGNRPPKVDSLKIDRENGRLPLTINATVQAKDPENDRLTYTWKIGSETRETKEPKLQYTFNKTGEFAVSVEVKDEEGASNKSADVTVFAGNEQPVVNIEWQGNQVFYFPGKLVQYEVKVTDGADSIDPKNLFIGVDYLQGNEDLAAQGHQIVPDEIMGKNLVMASDCKSCHKENAPSIGPSYMQVSNKYKNDNKAGTYLMQKIIKGGGGVWGEVAMPAHPTLREGDAKQMVQWIMSLSGGEKTIKSLPAKGTITPKPPVQQNQGVSFALTASYTDAGKQGVRPLTGSKRIILRNSNIDASQAKIISGFTGKDTAGAKYLVIPSGEGVIKLDKIDLAGIKSIQLTGLADVAQGNYTVEVRLGSSTGTVVGQGNFASGQNKKPFTSSIPVKANSNKVEDLYLVVRAVPNTVAKPLLKAIRFNP